MTNPSESPEFKAAVAAEVNAQLKPLLDAMAAKGGPPVVPGNGDLGELFNKLALAIADISDQGTDRKRIDPRILAERAAEHNRMVDAMVKAKETFGKNDPDRPRYRLIAKVFFNEQVIDPFTVDPATKRPLPQEIYWSGVPNLAMQPVNDSAKEIFRHFLGSIGNETAEQKKTAQWVSFGGLTIAGSGPVRRQIPETAQDAPTEYVFPENLAIAVDPTKPEVNILGTVAAPAKQNYAGEPAHRS